MDELIMASKPFDPTSEEFPKGHTGFIHCMYRWDRYDSPTTHVGTTEPWALKSAIEGCQRAGHLIRMPYITTFSALEDYYGKVGTYLGPEKIKDLFADRDRRVYGRLIKSSVQPLGDKIPEGFAPWWFVHDTVNSRRGIRAADPVIVRTDRVLGKLFAPPEDIARFSEVLLICWLNDLSVRIQIPPQALEYHHETLGVLGLTPDNLLYGANLD